MKKLDKLIIRSFIGPFVLTFVLILFILLMQFVWKYLDDLMGKGLDWTIIAELLIFQSTNLVPLALPLAILLSSIMTMGTLAENYELVALKSSGLSLFKIIRPLVVFIFLVSVGAFFFSNNVTPYANLKSKSMLHDIIYHKPLLEVKEGVFYNGLAGFSMRIGRKDLETDRLYDVMIYDHRLPDRGAATVIRAKEGVMGKTISGRYLVLTLFDGVSYDDQTKAPVRKKKRQTPHLRTTFDEMELRIDVSSLAFSESDEERWTNNIPMQNMEQLSSTADSLTQQIASRKYNVQRYMMKAFFLTRDTTVVETEGALSVSLYLDTLSLDRQGRVLRVAYNMANNSGSYLKSAKKDIDNRVRFIDRHWNEWHRKLTLSFACVILFFIGAPLGAIIKKGGLGLPVIFSIIFFLIFHISSISGEKMVKSGSWEPFQGMWLSTLILLPFALFLTNRAANDSALFDRSAYEKFFNRFRKKKLTEHEDLTDLP